jgi:hypothetical protein
LKRYGAAKRESLPRVEHRQRRSLHNRGKRVRNVPARVNGRSYVLGDGWSCT